ncbi:MAG: helix-turn-helix transcriptional regulator [Bacteroidales bacterium]|nr:helix-turn-helix transcriptional regulator [Bacteroidales bacterium]
MNQRLQQFLSAENLTQTQLAERLGVAKASVSHVLAGRNKPGYDFIESLSRQFPNLSLDWLINGKGRMYKITGQENVPEPQGEELIEFGPETGAPLSDSPKIVKVVVFYDNGTFQEIV